MRDPDRIGEILAELTLLWARMPDQRLCQLIFQICAMDARNVEPIHRLHWCQHCGASYENDERPLHSFEDEEFLKLLRAFGEKTSKEAR